VYGRDRERTRSCRQVASSRLRHRKMFFRYCSLTAIRPRRTTVGLVQIGRPTPSDPSRIGVPDRFRPQSAAATLVGDYGHGPRVSPWARCAGTAFSSTRIDTFPLWQSAMSAVSVPPANARAPAVIATSARSTRRATVLFMTIPSTHAKRVPRQRCIFAGSSALAYPAPDECHGTAAAGAAATRFQPRKIVIIGLDGRIVG
jgi:hypothetical protein